MYGGSRLPKADKFLKKHKKLKLWHRLLLLAGSIVVFITTYMLILPAITAEIGTLDIYLSEDSVSSGGAVIEGVADSSSNDDKADLTESTTEETTEERDSTTDSGADLGGSGSGSSGSITLADGTIVNVTLEKIEEANTTETASLFGNVLSLAATAGNSDGSLSIKYYGNNADESFVAVYDSETGDFKVNLNIDFELSQDLLTDYSGTIIDNTRYTKYYSITLPAGVVLPENMVYNDDTRSPIYNGYKTGTSEVIFLYCFVPLYNDDGTVATDEYGNTIYTAVMVFDEEYLDTLNGGDIVGTMHIDAYLSSNYYTEDGSIIVTDDTLNLNIEINYEQIEFSENETINHDITVTKKGSYNTTNNTITYTVMVLTQKGTNDTVVITDSFSDSDFLTKLGAELTAIEYKQGTVGLSTDGNGKVYTSDSYTTYTELTELSQTSEGTGYYYDDNGNLIITLPGLEASDGEQYTDYDWMSNYKNANAYYVTYTYSINPESDVIYIGENTAKSSVYDSTAQVTIYDTDTATVQVTGKRTITKTGSYDKENETITWTITVGDGDNTVNGYILYDDMFAELKSADEITITDIDGTTISSDYYEIVYDTDGTTIKGIKFISGEDEVIQYVITYSTEERQEWSYKNITNEADLEVPDDGGTLSDKATVKVDGLSDCFKKTFDTALMQDNGTYILNWTTTFSVPKSGIDAGITFTDVLEGNGHYITAVQAAAIKEALIAAWGDGVIKDIQFYTGNNRWHMDSSLWVDADNIDVNNAEIKYYQFRYTMAQDVLRADEGDNKITYSYATTADVVSGGEVDTITYYNTIYDSKVGTSKSASWSYYKEVIKYGTDSNGSLSSYQDTNITVTNGEVSWIVRVVLTPGNTYTITDTLPEGVTLSEIYAITNNTNCNTQLATSEDVQIELTNGVSGTVYVTYEGIDENNNVTIKAVNDATNRNMLYIKYVCKIIEAEEKDPIISEDGEGGVVAAGSKGTVYELTNYVEVTENDGESGEYGSDDQTTTVTWQDEDTSSEILTKNQQFDTNNNVIKYSLNINPTATTYVTSSGETYSDLVITDILEYDSFPNAGIARNASLVLSSVSLYYAQTDEKGNVLYDNDGNLIKGNKLSSSEYTWTYDVNVKDESWREHAIKTINLTVPNGTALVFEYEFLVTIIVDEDASWSDSSANVTNSAMITIGGETISSVPGVTTKDEISDSGTSASAHGAAGYTIYKVDEDNFSLPLKDAVFDLYVWTSALTDDVGNITEEAGFKKIDSFTTSSTGYTGISGKLNVDSETEEKYYEITLSDGSTYNLPADTICYFVESSAPEGYKTDSTTKYYFYYGSSVATTLSTVLHKCGYVGSDIISAENLITSHTQYITNAHSWDYYAEKTSISVIKRWLDSTDNEITKTDGSISFQLYRVFTDVNGVQGYAPGSNGGDTGEDPIESSTVKLNWTEYDKSNTVNTANSGNVTCNKNSTVTVNVSFNSGWYPHVLIKDASDGTILAYATGTFDNYSGMSSDDATVEWKDNGSGGYTLSTDIDIGESKRNISIYFGASDSEITQFAKISVDGAVEETTVTTEATTETTTSLTEETESTTTVYYYHVFDDDYLEITDTEISHIYGDKVIYKGSFDESAQDANYFTINGSLSQSHGTTYWDLNGDGVLSSNELLATCLKMETNYDGSGTATNIAFTAKEGGVLTLVFNANGNGNESSVITNGVYIDGTLYTAANNVITAYLEAGEHTISRSSYCFMFYMSFEEGAIVSGTTISEHIHNFDSGTNSTFYTIIGSTANNKGIVSYDNMDILTCLKMNSKANITFNNKEDGTLYMIFTNPNGAAVVGAVIDGVTHYAGATGEYDSNGNEIYELTTRIAEGEHTITRINSTEVMLYYIEYVPDDFGSGEKTDEVPKNKYAELLGTYEISATNSWSWSNTNLLWQVLDDDGNLLGYYSYYVVEVDEEGNYITKYLNNSSKGIQSGSIAIYNQDNGVSSTALTVVKNWLNSDGQPLSTDKAENSIAFTLFARVNIYENYRDSYMGGTDYSRYITDSEVSNRVYNNEGSFFNIEGSRPYNGLSSSQYGTATYNEVTYTNSIKTDSNFSVKFTSPATSGILTLLFGYNNQKADPSQGYGFAVDMPSGDNYRIAYYGDGTLTVYKNGTGSSNLIYNGNTSGFSDENISMIAVDFSENGVVFTLFVQQPGDYNIIRNSKISSNQSYLFYMDFSYQYQYLVEGEGVYTGAYTITSDEGWTKTISGLPYLIYDDEGNEIGYYSYYVVETSPSEGYDTTISYTEENDVDTGNETITKGEIVITNKEKVVGVILPETGGAGKIKYMLAGLLLSMTAGLLLYKRRDKIRV